MRCFTSSGVALGLAVTLGAGACHAPPLEMQTLSRSVELDKTESVHVEFRMRAGELRVAGGSSRLLDASFGIGSIGVRGLEKRGDAWYNAGHEDDPIAIRVDVEGGVGEIVISAEQAQ